MKPTSRVRVSTSALTGLPFTVIDIFIQLSFDECCCCVLPSRLRARTAQAVLLALPGGTGRMRAPVEAPACPKAGSKS
jgi:hypothetical protein